MAKAKKTDVPSINSTNSSINVHKIENGFLVRISRSTPNKFVEKEYYAKSQNEVKDLVSKLM